MIELTKINFPENLPITSRKDEIINAIVKNRVVIVAGETGSGKSTQIPKMCVVAGQGKKGRIGCTQPRRIAATTIAHRIAEELGENINQSVGYKIRFQDKSNHNSTIKVMTDGILLAESRSDQWLSEYDTIIVDEAHERSLNIDFLLGILKRLIKKRHNLKLVITSATIDTHKFSEAFDHAPIIQVSGRMYPVTVEYMPTDSDISKPEQELDSTGSKSDLDEISYVDMAVNAVESLRKRHCFGDILIFMPTERDIRETCETIENKKFSEVTIFPLFARLSNSDQHRVFAKSECQKIIVATNIAETSLTIPGIQYVIDTGLARISQYLPKSRTTGLPVKPISRSSADQRKGRCGRLQDGICIRLYSENDYLSRPQYTLPEIQRSNLAEVILRMIALNLGNIESFPFIDRPSQSNIKDGFDLLYELGAITKKADKHELTLLGKQMAQLPLDPRIARMIVQAKEEQCLDEVIIIASALSIQDVRERPKDKEQQADSMHKLFHDPASDFLTLLNIKNKFDEISDSLKTQSQIRKFCKNHFINYNRMREWRDIMDQIINISKDENLFSKNEQKQIANDKNANDKNANDKNAKTKYERIHRSVLSGFLSNIALKRDKNIFTATKGKEVMIFPGSVLFNHPGDWIVAAEIIETSRKFARTVANIECSWIEPLAQNLCNRSYSDARWNIEQGQVIADETVSLFGLTIVSKRTVSYGRINPKTANEIFIQSALVQGETNETLPFLTYNQELIEKLSQIEHKVRRKEILVDNSVVAAFYRKHIPNISDIRTLKKLIKDKQNDNFLRLSKEDLIISEPDENELNKYPDFLTVNNQKFSCKYVFEPGKAEDGITLQVPLAKISDVSLPVLEWGVVGLRKEKITALIKGLPKKFRKQLMPIANTAEIISNELKQTDQSLITELSNFIYHRLGIDIPSTEWSSDNIPEHLQMRVALTNHKGQEVIASRDINTLKNHCVDIRSQKELEGFQRVKSEWERTGLTLWDFGDLPDVIPINDRLHVYIALEPSEKSVNLRIFETKTKADTIHKKGVSALYRIVFSKELKLLQKSIKIPQDHVDLTIYFGGVNNIETGIYNNITNALFYKPIRTETEFQSNAAYANSIIFVMAEDLRKLILGILDTHHEMRSTLYDIENKFKANIQILELINTIRDEINQLLPKNFPEVYTKERMTNFQRYLKAMKIRVERAMVSYEKDQIKTSEINRYENALKKMTYSMTDQDSDHKRAALDELFWMIKEYKVSIFAQELKTRIPISSKRLDEKIKEIERMI